jgi:hypothetical protein
LERGKKSSTLPKTYLPTSFGKREKKGEKNHLESTLPKKQLLKKKGKKVSTPFFLNFHL